MGRPFERRLGGKALLLATVDDKQVVEINFVRIEDVIVGGGVHKYTFFQTVCKADSMPHFVNCDVCLLATGKRT